MKQIDCSTLQLPFLCKQLNYMPTPYAQVICCIEDGRPIAGVVYDGYNGAIISAHIWIDDEARPSKEWYAAIFDYPFNRLGIYKIIGQVNSNNVDAVRLDTHLGFILEAKIEGYYDDRGDLLIFSMVKEQCRVLNSKAWARVAQRVTGV